MMKKKGCNHNPNDETNSLKGLKDRRMVYPQEYYFICEKCKKPFRFVKNADGAFEIMEK